jgi:hypothetical protein
LIDGLVVVRGAEFEVHGTLNSLIMCGRNIKRNLVARRHFRDQTANRRSTISRSSCARRQRLRGITRQALDTATGAGIKTYYPF